MTPVLRLEAVRYAYPGSRAMALDGIDVELEAGRVIGIVGPNDAGKSTLCVVASGLAPRFVGGRLDGSVRLGGVETRDLAPHESAQRCGLLFQNPETQLSRTAPTVFEEIAIGPRNLGLALAEVLRRVDSALGVLGIADLAARDPSRLSGGQAQLVALACVLALEPPLLALDEPTSELDPEGTRLVGDALARLSRQRGTAILIAEHKTALLQAMADEVVLLDQGRVVLAGPAPKVLADPTLATHGVASPPAVERRLPVAAG
jgi:energy-coupling factor transporter ATP-binding protein EcfA2